MRLDLLDPATIAAAAETVGSEGAALDVPGEQRRRGVQGATARPARLTWPPCGRAFETNFFGTLAVTQAMLPLLRRSASALVVNQSSSIGSLSHQSDPSWVYAQAKPIGYGAAKASMNMMTIQLAAELKDEGISVVSTNPGLVRTDLNGRTRGAPVEEGAKPAIDLILSGGGRTGIFVGPDGPEPW